MELKVLAAKIWHQDCSLLHKLIADWRKEFNMDKFNMDKNFVPGKPISLNKLSDLPTIDVVADLVKNLTDLDLEISNNQDTQDQLQLDFVVKQELFRSYENQIVETEKLLESLKLECQRVRDEKSILDKKLSELKDNLIVQRRRRGMLVKSLDDFKNKQQRERQEREEKAQSLLVTMKELFGDDSKKVYEFVRDFLGIDP